MKRRILLVDDEVAVLLTMKAVLEISGFDVDTAASAKEGKSHLRKREYQMVITDMRMESDEAGQEVIRAALTAAYRPAIALLTAFPVDEGDWQDLGADQLLLKPMHTRILLDQIEQLFAARDKRLVSAPPPSTPREPAVQSGKKIAKAAKKVAGKRGKPASKAALKSSSAASVAKKTAKPAKKAARRAKSV